jgi:hypothetical protein
VPERKPRTINIGGEEIIDPQELFGPLKEPDDAVIRKILEKQQMKDFQGLEDSEPPEQFTGREQPDFQQSLIDQFTQQDPGPAQPAQEQDGQGSQGGMGDLKEQMSNLSRDMGQMLQVVNDIHEEIRNGITLKL